MYLCMCITFMHYLQRSEYDVRCSESEITDIGESSCGY